MIEKLLELFLHAKAGAISGVLLIGASGALVSATTQNGVTTITVTQASPTPSASASPSPSPSASASPRPSPSPSPSPSPRPSPSAAPSLAATSPAASPTATHACVEATQTVNAAFHTHHGALAKLRSGDDHGTSAQTATAQTAANAKLTVKQADELLKTIRKVAVKAIHETCKTHDDDEDDDEDKDEDEDDDDKAPKTPKSGLVLTGTPAEIAKQATAAMDLVMAAVGTTARPTTTAKSGHEKDRDEQKSKDKGKSKKGGRD